MLGVVMKRKYASPLSRNRLAKFWARLASGTRAVAAAVVSSRAASWALARPPEVAI